MTTKEWKMLEALRAVARYERVMDEEFSQATRKLVLDAIKEATGG